MDKNFALRNLDEVCESLQALIHRIEQETSDNLDDMEGILRAEFKNVYWKLNKVWNARHMTQQHINDAPEAEYNEWYRFPQDLHL